MRGMFNECKRIRHLPNLSFWNMKKVKEMDFMFNECGNLYSLPDINKWEINEKANINSSIFNNCFSLISFPNFYSFNINDDIYRENINIPNLGMDLIGRENLELNIIRFAEKTGMG